MVLRKVEIVFLKLTSTRFEKAVAPEDDIGSLAVILAL
jgi:hypothetical protein